MAHIIIVESFAKFRESFREIPMTPQRVTQDRPTSLCLNSVSKVLCCKNYYSVEFITRHTPSPRWLQYHPSKASSLLYRACIGVHSSLPQYPPCMHEFDNIIIIEIRKSPVTIVNLPNSVVRRIMNARVELICCY